MRSDPVEPGRQSRRFVHAEVDELIYRRMPLTDAGRAMTLAESKTAYGKVVLVP